MNLYFHKQSIPGILDTCRVRIENSLDSPEIMEAVAAYGYDKAALEYGKSLLEQATTLYHQKIREDNEQSRAGHVYDESFDRAHGYYMDLVEVARREFKYDPDTYRRLGLFGRRIRVFTDWLPQVKHFYQEAQEPDILKALGKWNIDKQRLEKGLALVDETVVAHDRHIKEAGEAQEITPERDAAVDAIYDWTDDYQTIAVIALKDKPQLLEKIGILVKS